MSNCDSISNSQLSPIPESGEPFYISEETVHGPFRLMTMMRMGRKFMVKGLMPEYVSRPEYRELLHKEFDLGVRFNHPYIVGVFSYEYVEDYGECIIMEYVDGVTLDKFLAEKPHRSERVRIARELAEAVNYMHSKGVSHRDLKPDNIMVTREDSHVVIIDFGLGDSQDFAILKSSSATLSYGAPEQLTSNVADMKSDIYSLGLIFRDLHLPIFYHGIISHMLRHEPAKRPSIKKVITSIYAIDRWSSRIPFLAIAMIGVIVISALLFHKISTETEFVQPIVATDTVKTPEVNTQVPDTQVLTDFQKPSAPPVSIKNNDKNVDIGNADVENKKSKILIKIYDEEIKKLDRIYFLYDSTFQNRGHGGCFMTYNERTKLVYATADTLKERLLRAGIDALDVDNAVSAYWMRVSNLMTKNSKRNRAENDENNGVD